MNMLAELELLLGSGLEHAAHGWEGLRRQGRVPQTEHWPPPNEDTIPHSPEWYLANTLQYLKQAYDLVADAMPEREEK